MIHRRRIQLQIDEMFLFTKVFGMSQLDGFNHGWYNYKVESIHVKSTYIDFLLLTENIML